MIKDIIKLVEKRKKGLKSLLAREGLSNQVRQQIKGAIGESDIFLRVLEDHRNDEIHKEMQHFNLLKSKDDGDKKDFFSRLLEKKGMFWKEDTQEDAGQEAS